MQKENGLLYIVNKILKQILNEDHKTILWLKKHKIKFWKVSISGFN